MNHTEHILEFDKIKEKWMEFALTEHARQLIADTTICMSESELLVKQRETSEAKTLLEKAGNPPLISLSGIQNFLAIALKGDCLTAEQLELVETSLTATRRLMDYLGRGKQFDVSLAYYDENLDSLDTIRDAIHSQIRNGKVEDSASKLLKNLRIDIEKIESKMNEKANAVMRKYKECMSDNFTTTRNGHLCLPVKKEYKLKISGSVMDQSATGNTLFIEPTEVAKYYEELQYLRLDEENEVRRILYTLTAMFAEASDVMEQNIRTIEKLDFIFSKGKLSLSYDGTEPKINTNRKIAIKNGRHPLMDKNICIPLQFEIGNECSCTVRKQATENKR